MPLRETAPPHSRQVTDHAAPERVAGALAQVDDVLAEQVREHATTLIRVHEDLRPLADVLRKALTGGKRLRAAFCLWGAHGASGTDTLPSGAVQVAAAIELFHLAALIHDDVMDHSDERRGRPTIHRRFADAHVDGGLDGDPDSHGEAIAILAGDLCLTWSDDVIAAGLAGRGADVAATTRRIWTTMRDEAIAGQYLDVFGQATPTMSLTRNRLVLQFKSAKYTVSHPLRLGGAIGGAGPELLGAYDAIGLTAGEAFQLRDDVLGVFGDPEVTGKPVLDDIREGKRTMLVTLADQHGSAAQRRLLGRHLGDPHLDEAGLACVRDIFRDTGALEHVERRIRMLSAESLDIIGTLDVDDATRHALADLVRRCVWRNV